MTTKIERAVTRAAADEGYDIREYTRDRAYPRCSALFRATYPHIPFICARVPEDSLLLWCFQLEEHHETFMKWKDRHL